MNYLVKVFLLIKFCPQIIFAPGSKACLQQDKLQWEEQGRKGIVIIWFWRGVDRIRTLEGV